MLLTQLNMATIAKELDLFRFSNSGELKKIN